MRQSHRGTIKRNNPQALFHVIHIERRASEPRVDERPSFLDHPSSTAFSPPKSIFFHCSGHLFTTKANSRNVIQECREAPEWNSLYRSPGLLFAQWHDGPECGGPSLSISRAQSKTVNDLEAKVAPRRRISVARPFAFHPAVSPTQRCLSRLPSSIAFAILHRVRV